MNDAKKGGGEKTSRPVSSSSIRGSPVVDVDLLSHRLPTWMGLNAVELASQLRDMAPNESSPIVICQQQCARNA